MSHVGLREVGEYGVEILSYIFALGTLALLTGWFVAGITGSALTGLSVAGIAILFVFAIGSFGLLYKIIYDAVTDAQADA